MNLNRAVNVFLSEFSNFSITIQLCKSKDIMSEDN